MTNDEADGDRRTAYAADGGHILEVEWMSYLLQNAKSPHIGFMVWGVEEHPGHPGLVCQGRPLLLLLPFLLALTP